MPVVKFNGNDPEAVRKAMAEVKAGMRSTKVLVASEEDGGSHETKKNVADYGRALPMPNGDVIMVAKAAKFGVALVPVEDDEVPLKKEYPEAEVIAVMSMIRGNEGLFVDFDADELRDLGTQFISTAAMMDEGVAALKAKFGG